MYKLFIKRIIDIILSLVLLIITFPIIIISLLIIYFYCKKILFIQERPGVDSKIFKLIKFKTMNDKRNINGELLPDDQRITSIGKIIRKLSIDELPQLINVLKGDMSLIGPRPLLPEYLQFYSAEQMRRHQVRPGITGWAQVNGRNSLSWEKKFELDVWYVDNISFKLDVQIFWLTILKIVKREGISSETSATMERFDKQFSNK